MTNNDVLVKIIKAYRDNDTLPAEAFFDLYNEELKAVKAELHLGIMR